ncbi:unnamed protein product [Calypogeia fissa]
MHSFPIFSRSCLAIWTQSASVGSSPGKYIAPRLKRSASPAAPATVLTKRPLAMVEPLVWRDTTANQQSTGIATSNVTYSPPSCSPPPHKMQVAFWGSGSTFAAVAGPLLPAHGDTWESTPSLSVPVFNRENVPACDPQNSFLGIPSPSLVGPASAVPDLAAPEDGAPATTTFCRLFRSVCRASRSNVVFEGARIKHGRFSTVALSSSIHDHSLRGVILSFSQRTPSYNHFRVWIDTQFP